MAGSTQPAFRIDVDINDLLLHSTVRPPAPPEPKGAMLPEPIFPQHPGLLSDPGRDVAPVKRQWQQEHIMRKVRGWLIPYVRSRATRGISSTYRLFVR
jgi:hypothetical protein